MARHVFIDNSNIYGGAQRAAETCEPGTIWLAVRVYFRNLLTLLEANDAATRVMAGSVPPGNEELWHSARDLGYDTDLLRRVEQDDGRLGEQAVDEMLHLKMANAVLDHTAPQTLVIASGDGKVSQWNTSFPGQAERALRAGWNVEVWSWRAQHTAKYGPLARQYPGKLTQSFLDPHYKALTFTKAGKYTVNGCEIEIAGRVVARLRANSTEAATATIEPPRAA